MSMLEIADGRHLKELLREIIQNSAQGNPLLSQFEVKKNQGSIMAWLVRLQQTLDLPNETVASGVALLKKIGSKGVRITQRLIMKIMVVCLMLIQKVYSDDKYSIEDYSLATGISMGELAAIELQIVTILDYNVLITERQYYDVITYQKSI